MLFWLAQKELPEGNDIDSAGATGDNIGQDAGNYKEQGTDQDQGNIPFLGLNSINDPNSEATVAETQDALETSESAESQNSLSAAGSGGQDHMGQ